MLVASLDNALVKGGALTREWMRRVCDVDLAFQPVVSIHSGQCFGWEALLRDVDRAGFGSIGEFFDAAHRDGVLPQVEHELSEKALRKFKTIPNHASRRLFLNMDNRSLEDVDRALVPLQKLLREVGVRPTALCLELSERHPLLGREREGCPAFAKIRKSEIKIALDDFGTGFSGLQVLYFAEPDIVKIDRFFISDIARNPKKRIFVASMVSVAHLLGALVIAEGVETRQEFFTCLGIGCDLVQGNFVQAPQQDTGRLLSQYPVVERTARRDRRRARGDQRLICSQIEPLPPVGVETGIADVLQRFREHRPCTFFPVVNDRQEPLGIIREDALKDYIYGEHGHPLMNRRAIREFVTKCPIADVNLHADRILEVFTMGGSAEGVLIVKDMQYLGFLSARALLKIIHEKNLAAARDQNPLSRLPGNHRIHAYLKEVAQDTDTSYMIAYFDFDSFKPFNDFYGFREGDRAIMLFAEMLKRKLLHQGSFIGHVGGDDFIVGFKCAAYDTTHATVKDLIRQFRHEVESLYRPQERQAGYIVAKDRDGSTRRFSLLRVSAALLSIPAHRPGVAIGDLTHALAELKKCAKDTAEGLASACLWTGSRTEVRLSHAAV